MSLDEIMKSNEPLGLEDGLESLIRFRGVEVMSLDTQQTVVLEGPVDLSRYGPLKQRITSRQTGLPIEVPIIRFLVSELDGEPVDMPWNVVSKRVYTQLAGDLETGAYRQLVYGIQQTGVPPKTKYQVRRMPPTQ